MVDAKNPHDAVFRRFLSRPTDAASELRAMLPETVTARVDWGALAQVPGSFVDEKLRWRHSDVLFHAPLDGRDALIYLLIEHQSSSDPLMPYRMLRYVARIWDKHLHDNPATIRLPVIFPLVLHHGAHPWNAPVRLRDLIDAPAEVLSALGDHIPGFRFALDDLTRTNLDALRERALTPAALVTLVVCLGNDYVFGW